MFSNHSVYSAPVFALGDEDEDGATAPLKADAVRILLRNTLLYQGYHFPAPISFIPFVFVSIPSFTLQRIAPRFFRSRNENDTLNETGGGGNVANALRVIENLEGILWWILIWPPSIVLAGLWGWGFHAPVPEGTRTETEVSS